ncbi:MAG: cell division protein ZipA [bacterium]
MDELRWTLLIIGAILLAGVYFFGRPGNHKPKPDKKRIEPEVFHDESNDEGSGLQKTEAPIQSSQPDKVVALFVRVKHGQVIDGDTLYVAADKAGLSFGKMNIFHRILDGEPDGRTLFSMANMVEPGHFELSAMAELETPGVSFFMVLPGPDEALNAWDSMLATAERVAELINGEVLDKDRNVLTRQHIAHIRDEMRTWDREHSMLKGHTI